MRDKCLCDGSGKDSYGGTRREIFSQGGKIKESAIYVPQVTLLANELQKRGLSLPDGILTTEN